MEDQAPYGADRIRKPDSERSGNANAGRTSVGGGGLPSPNETPRSVNLGPATTEGRDAGTATPLQVTRGPDHPLTKLYRKRAGDFALIEALKQELENDDAAKKSLETVKTGALGGLGAKQTGGGEVGGATPTAGRGATGCCGAQSTALEEIEASDCCRKAEELASAPNLQAMSTKRPKIPKATSGAVLKEFNHRCAMCGANSPHLHHVDEDRTNNDPNNLLPLCPNCHLTDQHDPTRSHPVGVLKLFRRFKDPSILTPQFVPLFNRMEAIFTYNTVNTDATIEAAYDFAAFVKHLHSGAYYAARILAIVFPPSSQDAIYDHLLDPHSAVMAHKSTLEHRLKMSPDLEGRRTAVEGFVVELLRYQNWIAPHHGRTGS